MASIHSLGLTSITQQGEFSDQFADVAVFRGCHSIRLTDTPVQSSRKCTNHAVTSVAYLGFGFGIWMLKEFPHQIG